MDLSTRVEARLAPALFEYSMLGHFRRLRVNRGGVFSGFRGLGMGACRMRLSGFSCVRLTRFSRMRTMSGHSFVPFGEQPE